MNLDEAQVAVSDELSAPDVEPITLTRAINLAIRRAEKKHDFLAMERENAAVALLTDITTYALGTVAPNYKAVRKFYIDHAGDDSPWFIVKVESKERFKEVPRTSANYDTATSGFPELYIVDSANVIVSPAPTADATAVFLYYQYLPDLALVTDTNFFTETHEDMIIADAARRIARKLEHFDKMALYDAEFKSELAEAIDLDVKTRKSNLQFVQGGLPDLGFRINRN